MKKRMLLVPLCLFLTACRFSAAAQARTTPYFSFRLDPSQAGSGGLVRLRTEAFPAEVTAAGFRLRVSYDEDRLEFLGTETAGAVKSGTMRTNGGAGKVSCVYVCNAGGASAPRLSGNVASFLFQVEPGAAPGKTALTVETDQVCDYEGRLIDGTDAAEKLNLEIRPVPSSKARLSALKPSAGALSPAFSPEVTSYLLSVESGVGAVEFQADAAENGSVRVSRRTLNAAGKETEITVTVTSADGTEATRYLIRVERAPKTAARSPGAEVTAARTSGASRPKGGITGSGGGSGAKKTGTASGGRAAPGAADGADAGGGRAVSRQAAGGSAPLVVVGDRLPPYLFGMLACGFCVTVGVAVSLWLPIRPRK